MANSQLEETDETSRVEERSNVSLPESEVDGRSGVPVSHLTAPTVLDSEDPFIQSKVTRLPEALSIQEDTDLHLRTFGVSDDETEESQTV